MGVGEVLCHLTLVLFLLLQAETNVDKGKFRLAVEDYKAALALDPAHVAYNVHLHLGLCKVLVRLGRGKDALSSCTEALNIDEELLEALVQVGIHLQNYCMLICCKLEKTDDAANAPTRLIR